MKTYRTEQLKKFGSLSLAVALLFGCASKQSATIESSELSQPSIPGLLDVEAYDEFGVFTTHKRISDYTSRIAHDLAKSMRNTATNPAILVGSFDELNGNTTDDSNLARAIKQSLIGQLQNQQFTVIDDRLLTNKETDHQDKAVFAENKNSLLKKHAQLHVLTGVMIKDANGVTINVRIADQNSLVVSAASVLIPHYIADAYF